MATQWKRAGPGHYKSDFGELRLCNGVWYFRHYRQDVEVGPFDTAVNAKKAVDLLSKRVRTS